MRTLTLINTPIGLGFGKRIGVHAIARSFKPKQIFVICPAVLKAVWEHEVDTTGWTILTYEKALRYNVDIEAMLTEDTALIFDELKSRGSGRKTRPALEILMKKAGFVIVLDHECPKPNFVNRI